MPSVMPGSPSSFFPAQVPRQERLYVLRNLAPGRLAALEVPRQPFPGIELPQTANVAKIENNAAIS